MELSLSTQEAIPSATRGRRDSVSIRILKYPSTCSFGSVPHIVCWLLDLYSSSRPILDGPGISMELAKRNNRSLLCGAAISPALSTPHLASYPIWARSPRIDPSPRTTRAGEFSTKTKSGPISRTTRAISLQSPERSSCSPSPFPATLVPWHGKPPHTIFDLPFHGLPSKVLMLSQIGNRGRMPSRCLCKRTFLLNGSISTAQTQVCPSSIPPRIPPPHPAKRCSSFNLVVRRAELTLRSPRLRWLSAARA